MSIKVNLDALVPREDFEIQGTSKAVGKTKDTVAVSDLRQNDFFFASLRKPDFQRETSEWSPSKVAELVSCFVNGDLIPATILWRNNAGFTFVIDGAHRLSALAAWINDDYGDGSISKNFFGDAIPEGQIDAAKQTRKLIGSDIGHYHEYIHAMQNPHSTDQAITNRARTLGALAVQLQWVEGDAAKAEASFFKINQSAAPLNRTEIKLLKNRRQPNSIAARAIVRAGQGHKYWSAFPLEHQKKIESQAKEINELLFEPDLRMPIKTLDIPVGGKVTSAYALPLILDFVNIVNGDAADNDFSGEATEHALQKCLAIAKRMTGISPESLGLHPAVYFYARTGRYKVASFYASVAMVVALGKINSGFADFTRVRRDLEEFLVDNDYVIQQIVRKNRGAFSSYPQICKFLLQAIGLLNKGVNRSNLLDELRKQIDFQYVTTQEHEYFEGEVGEEFDRGVKSEIYLREALTSPLRCSICGGLLPPRSTSIDHVERRSDGGSNAPSNGALSHPYCNTTYKN